MFMKNFDYHARIFDNLPDSYKKWIDEERVFLRNNIKRDSKILEVGCGDGRSLKDIVDITQDIIGIDIDEKAIICAKENLKKYPKVKIIRANGKKIPFDNSTFDFVLCMTSFVNFDKDKYKILDEMRRILKDNGKIIMSVFNEDSLSERIKEYNRINLKIKKIEGNKVIFDKSVGANTSEQFSKEQLKEIFDKENLRIDEIKKAGVGYVLSVIKK